jgi:hypothetical protein
MKIEFHSISFRNFLTFGNQTQKFELKSGLNLITGLDQSTGRSNGAGKCVIGSTMLNISIDDERVLSDFLSFLNH